MENIRLKTKGTVYKQFPFFIVYTTRHWLYNFKLLKFLMETQVSNSEIVYFHTGLEQISKWLVESANQVSHHWRGKIANQQGEKARMSRMTLD